MNTKGKKVKSQVQLVKKLEKAKSLIEAAHAAFGGLAPNFTGDEKNRQPKAPPGLAAVVPTIAELVASFGAVVPMHSVDTMQANLETVKVLEPLRMAAQALLTDVENTQYYAGGEAWGSATAFYTVLRRVEGKDGRLAEGLKPLASFFKKRGGRKAGTPKKTTAKGSAPTDVPVTNGNAPAATPKTNA
jgi:hypothetical protein